VTREVTGQGEQLVISVGAHNINIFKLYVVCINNFNKDLVIRRSSIKLLNVNFLLESIYCTNLNVFTYI